MRGLRRFSALLAGAILPTMVDKAEGCHMSRQGRGGRRGSRPYSGRSGSFPVLKARRLPATAWSRWRRALPETRFSARTPPPLKRSRPGASADKFHPVARPAAPPPAAGGGGPPVAIQSGEGERPALHSTEGELSSFSFLIGPAGRQSGRTHFPPRSFLLSFLRGRKSGENPFSSAIAFRDRKRMRIRQKDAFC